MLQKFVVVGGGTAGWMAAIAIASRFPEKQIVVIDPEALGPIGVGESVTGIIMFFVTDPIHRLSVGEFVRRCDVTFKAGIWYKNWQGVGTEYLAPIDTPPDYFRHRYATCVEEFYAQLILDGIRVSDFQFYSQLMKTCRTDHFHTVNGSVNTESAHVSCHFDAVKFASFLRENAKTWPNIQHVDDVVESFSQDAETGNITSVRTRGGLDVAGDFFLDCSGFHRTLLAKAYSPKWLDYKDHIRVDSAIPCFQPFEPNREIPMYTVATAMPHGWMWQIPTQSRLGRGYLFSSRYIDVPQAIDEMRAAGVDPGDSPRVLRFEPGRFERQWIGNVCTIGLSGGFIEPLEASTIHGMYVQIRILCEIVVPFLTRESMPALAQQYNQLIRMAYDDYLDFINFHYQTGRNDTEFWRDYQVPTALTSRNQVRREKWRHAFPLREDFMGIVTQRVGHLTGLVLWLPMLDGLGILNRDHARRIVQMSEHSNELRENVARYAKVRDSIIPAALSHTEAINYFRNMA